MSLDDRDRAVLEHIDQEIDEATDADEFERIARDLRDRVSELRAEFRQFEGEVNRRLDALEEGETGSSAEEGPPVVHYADIPEDERGDLLSTSEHIAVTIHDRWDEIAWEIGTMNDRQERKVGIDTKTKANAKYNPSKIRHRLKVSLDRDFQANEIYRGMRQVAKLSGGVEHVGDHGRSTIAGGLYKYREMTTADNQETKRVLWRDDQ